MCTSKKLLFSTRSYRLRKWLESQYKTVSFKSESSNSYYYTVTCAPDRVFRIRISDHFTTDKKLPTDYSVVISFDPHDINKNVYIVTIKGFENNVISINDFRELKYDINHAIIYSKFFTDCNTAKVVHSENAVTKIKKEIPAQTVVSEYSDAGTLSAEVKNSPQRTSDKHWGNVCKFIPGWIAYDKNCKKAIKELFTTRIDFEDGCNFIRENLKLSKPNFIVAVYKKRNEVNKAAYTTAQ